LKKKKEEEEKAKEEEKEKYYGLPSINRDIPRERSESSTPSKVKGMKSCMRFKVNYIHLIHLYHSLF